MREQKFDCVVLDLQAARHLRLRAAGRRSSSDARLREMPIVVFTGRDLTQEEEAELRQQRQEHRAEGRADRPERLLDETALFLHRVIADLPEAKQRMIETLHDSDEPLRDRKVLVVDDDVRNIFALNSLLERHGMNVISATNGQDAIELLDSNPRPVAGPDGRHDAGDGRLRDHAAHPRDSRVPHAADHRADRQGHEGRPREMPGGRRFGLRGQAGEHRAAAVAGTDVAAADEAPMAPADAGGQYPAGRRPAGAASVLRAILEPLGQNLVAVQLRPRCARSADAAGFRGDPARCEHAGHGRLRDRGADPRSSALRNARRSSS